MMRTLVFLAFSYFSLLILGCEGEKECITYRLTRQVDLNNRDGGNASFTYNADGLLEKVSGRYQRDDKFFYDANHQLIRTEIGGENGTISLYAYDAKGRVISIYQDAAFIDSTVFAYDDHDRIVAADFYRVNPEILYYYEIEYPNASTVKKSVYLRDENTGEFELDYVDVYALDSNPRPHPREYYLYQFPIEEVFLPNNPLSIQTTYGGGRVITKSFTYNAGGYPVSEDDIFTYEYSCQ
jgi:hypothetical protein